MQETGTEVGRTGSPAREIGSEFWTRAPEGGEGIRGLFRPGEEPLYTLCGRTALERIVEEILARGPAEEVYLPSWCCHTMIEPFLRHGIRVRFYPVTAAEDGIRCRFRENPCGIVFAMDYFGFTRGETADFLRAERERGKTVICDVTHSLFSGDAAAREADFVFGSFRKWTGVNAGFALSRGGWTMRAEERRNDRFTDLRNRAFDRKARYIRGETGAGRDAEKELFLSDFRAAEEMLETDYSHYGPDGRSMAFLERLDTGRLRERRRRNAERLMDGLAGLKGVRLSGTALKENECPLFVPVFVEDGRDRLRSALIREGVYLPVHWPVSPLHELDAETGAVYRQELSCVCDQRYDEADMDRMIALFRSLTA